MVAKVAASTSQKAKGPWACIAQPVIRGAAMAPRPKVNTSPPDAAGIASLSRKSLV